MPAAPTKRLQAVFRRAGAWLALFHCFAGTDMHQENMIAAGEHPVPIDLEMILQASARSQTEEVEAQAFQAATETVDNSVMQVGLVPAYGRSPDNEIFAIGGMNSDWKTRTQLTWNDINSDAMRPAKTTKAAQHNPEPAACRRPLREVRRPHRRFRRGLRGLRQVPAVAEPGRKPGRAVRRLRRLAVRKVVRPTRFYYMLLQRL